MNRKKIVESRTLAVQLKEALRKEERCAIEIRAPVGSASHAAARRLHKSLGLAGFKSDLVEVVASPQSGVLIESSHETAHAALAMQSAFGAAGMEAHLLVQNNRRPNTVIIHLGEESAN